MVVAAIGLVLLVGGVLLLRSCTMNGEEDDWYGFDLFRSDGESAGEGRHRCTGTPWDQGPWLEDESWPGEGVDPFDGRPSEREPDGDLTPEVDLPPEDQAPPEAYDPLPAWSRMRRYIHDGLAQLEDYLSQQEHN